MRLMLCLMGLTFVVHAFATSDTQNPSNVVIVEGNKFRIPDTQDIEFIPLVKIPSDAYEKLSIPRIVDLRSIQSDVRHQGNRGACTYFVFTSLVESLMKKELEQEVDLSEEYLAWASKVKKKLRVLDEGSSVAVNAATFQEYGYMLEADMPYQRSWFDPGYPCESQKDSTRVDPVCYSHKAPDAQKPVLRDDRFIFEEVGSRSIDVVQALARNRVPVTLSMLGHRRMWEETKKSGDFFLSPAHKRECQKNPKICGGHAVLATGYDLDKRVIYIKNSWGTGWGNQGYGTIPFDYLDQMSKRKLMTGSISETGRVYRNHQ